MGSLTPKRCYITNQTCTCGGFDEGLPCPLDEYATEEELQDDPWAETFPDIYEEEDDV